MSLLIKITSLFDKVNQIIGRNISWFIILMVIVQLSIVMARYIYGIGFLELQELLIYLHGSLFTLAAGYTLLEDEHVRVDIFYRDSSKQHKKFINLICGVIFLLPVIVFIAFYSFDLIVMAWGIKEISTEAGGLPFAYIQKSLILLFPLTLMLALCNFILKKPWK